MNNLIYPNITKKIWKDKGNLAKLIETNLYDTFHSLKICQQKTNAFCSILLSNFMIFWSKSISNFTEVQKQHYLHSSKLVSIVESWWYINQEQEGKEVLKHCPNLLQSYGLGLSYQIKKDEIDTTKHRRRQKLNNHVLMIQKGF